MNTRTTKYSTEILEIVEYLRHATNAEIIDKLRLHYPTVSATTVHRVTVRLQSQGLFASAPPDRNGSMRYDANTTPHDHFICGICGGIRDLNVAESFIPKISNELGGCSISGRLVIYGECDKCRINPKKVVKK